MSDTKADGFIVNAGVHVYVEIEFVMSKRNTLEDVVSMGAEFAASEVREALTVRARSQDAALQEHRTKAPRLDAITIVRRGEPTS